MTRRIPSGVIGTRDAREMGECSFCGCQSGQEKADLTADLLADVLAYLDRPFVFWPHEDTCEVKRRDLVERLESGGRP